MSTLAALAAQAAPHFGRPEVGDHDTGRTVVGIILLVIALAAIVIAIVALVRVERAARAARGEGAPATGAGSARQVLDQRLATGEIDPADYEARRALLD